MNQSIAENAQGHYINKWRWGREWYYLAFASASYRKHFLNVSSKWRKRTYRPDLGR